MIFDQLYPATFKGATFYIDGSQTTSGGRKVVTFEYPNSDKRSMEDMGRLPDAFDMEGIVHGDSYLLDRDALRDALNSSGPGILTHPFYGVKIVTAEPYSISENMSDLGVAKFSMKFKIADKIIYPSILGAALSFIGKLGDELSKAVGDFLGSTFGISPGSLQNFTNGSSMLGTMFSYFNQGLSFIQNIAPVALNVFSAAIVSFKSGAGLSLFSSVLLGENILNAFNNILSVTENPKDKFSCMQSFFNYGDNFVSVPPTTIERMQRITNQNCLVAAVQTLALSNAYVAAAEIDYDNRPQLEIYKNTLETQYQKIYSTNNLPAPVLSILQDLRNSTRKFFDNIEANVLNIAVIQTNQISMTTLAYQYYGDTTQVNNLISLNPQFNPSFVSGSVNILAPAS